MNLGEQTPEHRGYALIQEVVVIESVNFEAVFQPRDPPLRWTRDVVRQRENSSSYFSDPGPFGIEIGLQTELKKNVILIPNSPTHTQFRADRQGL